MANQNSNKLYTVQGLRGLAALAVVLLHLGGTQKLGGILESQGLTSYGWIGVDLFFVISGFIMVWVTKDIVPGVKTAWNFITMRAVRIYPLWWACSLIIAALYLVIHGVPASTNIVPKPEAWGHFVQSFFLIPHEYGPSVGPGWSLIHELYFYIVFAAILLFGLRKHLWIPLALWTIITGAGLYLGWGQLGPRMSILFSPYTIHFIAGACVALIVLRQDKPNIGLPILVLGLLSLAGVIASGTVSTELRIWQLTVPLSLIVYGAVSAEQFGTLKTPKLCVWLGDISYSLYLTHWMVLLAWQIVMPIYPDGVLYGVVNGLPNKALIALDFTILLTGALITAHIFYIVIEKPSLKFLRARLPNYRSETAVPK